MRHKLYFLLTFLMLLSGHSAAKGYEVTFKVKGITNQMAIIGYHFMDNKYVQDSVYFNSAGIGVYKAQSNVYPGVYLAVFPSMENKYFEFILREANITIQTDTADFVQNMFCPNSKENTVFYEDIRYNIAQEKQMTLLRDLKSNTPETSPLYQELIDNIAALNSERKVFRTNLIKNNPDLLYAKMLKMMEDVEVPEPVGAQKEDSLYRFHYLRANYFSKIDFNEIGLCRTPVMYSILTSYFNNYVFPHQDSIIKVVDSLINTFSTSPYMYETVLKTYMRYFSTSTMMIHEPVYVHLSREYFLKGKAPWADSVGLSKLEKRIQEILPSLLLGPAPDLFIIDTLGYQFSISEVFQADQPEYLIIAFWNSDCSHCKVEMPEFIKDYKDSIAILPFKVVLISIGTDKELDKVKVFLKETGHENIISGYEPTGRFRSAYDVYATPMINIIDKQGKLIAKRISAPRVYPFLKGHYKDHHGN
jgi:thiol-disulfide isomerase/thioredoxin